MRSDSEIAREALRRACEKRNRKSERTRRIRGICSVAACLALVVALSLILPYAGGSYAPDGLYHAALFANGSAGGYALIGVIGFVLGVAVVVLYKRGKKD